MMSRVEGAFNMTKTAELVFYYPNPVWYYGDWVKNLILFFDGIALLVPKYMKQRPEEVDPAIVAGLKQHGLLHIIEPEKSVDKTAAFALRQTELDDLASDLRKKARQAWKRPASFGLTLAGAAIAASTGHPIGAALAIGAAALRFESSKKTDFGSYSYLFTAHERFG